MIRHRLFSVIIIVMWLGAGSIFAAPLKIDKKSPGKIASETQNKKRSNKDQFYRIARLIMTKEEKKIYKHLADKDAKLKFIEEFWEKRDPTPGTEENESKQEFYLRIAYANKWFHETSKGNGWDTERGRILLQLGFPDQRKFTESPPTYRGRTVTTKRIQREVWIYDRYQMSLFFDDFDDEGRLRLRRIPANFSYALDRAKFSLNFASKSRKKRDFKFDADYKAGNVEVSIPVKKVSFEEKDDRMIAEFGLKVYVYRNNVKVDEINMEKNYSMEKDKLLNMKTIEISIPCSLSEKGRYYLDVVIEEKNTEMKYRDFVKCKI